MQERGVDHSQHVKRKVLISRLRAIGVNSGVNSSSQGPENRNHPGPWCRFRKAVPGPCPGTIDEVVEAVGRDPSPVLSPSSFRGAATRRARNL